MSELRSAHRAPEESCSDVPVIALTISYDGTGFAGFARQDGPVTVQARIEEALGTLLRQPVETVCAGRTDAGVHARGQVVSFEATGVEPEPGTFARALTALAGGGIAVTEVRYARPGFSARFDALSREYRYRIATGPTPPVFVAHVAWWVKGALDLESMAAAAPVLIGERDFRSFCVTGSAEGKRTVRRLDSIELCGCEELGERLVEVRLAGNAFLHSMVRVIVGSLVEVGLGRRSPSWLGEVLEARERRAAGPTAPAHGLTLWEVAYPAGSFLDPPVLT